MSRPIGDYALLSDCHSAALVSRDGSVDWWCAPRFDSRSCFARLLDDRAGHWAINPVGDFESTRAYVPGTMVLRTEFRTAHGTVRLTDALVLEDAAGGHRIGGGPRHELVRLVEGVSGQVDLHMEFCPRLEYGLTVPTLQGTDGSIDTVGGPDRLRLDTGVSWQLGPDGQATLAVTVAAGQSYGFTLSHREGMVELPARGPSAEAAIEKTTARWAAWSALHDRYDGYAREHVARSALVLQALTYAPTGAIIAAATTSLPEIVGKDKNWDYRYGWLRDASITLKALWIGACPEEAEQYFRWMATSSGACSEDHVQIMFGVHGERDLTERSLRHLTGYANSLPVRVGNNAWKQRQLDVLGEARGGVHPARATGVPSRHSDLSVQARRHGCRDLAAAGQWHLGGPRG